MRSLGRKKKKKGEGGITLPPIHSRPGLYKEGKTSRSLPGWVDFEKEERREEEEEKEKEEEEASFNCDKR